MELKKNPAVDMSRYSLIFFQIGLIVLLSVSYGLMELKTYETQSEPVDVPLDVVYTMDREMSITRLTTPPPPPPPPAPPAPLPRAIEEFELVEDDVNIEETVIESTETNQYEYVSSATGDGSVVLNYYDEGVIENVPFAIIENVPIYPGCEDEKTNQARKECMSEKISLFVNRNFNNSLGSEYGLRGRQKLYVVFKIDEKGEVRDIASRGPHPALQAEAERVVGLLPKMIPGKQRDKPVRVTYSLPIIFDIQ